MSYTSVNEALEAYQKAQKAKKIVIKQKELGEILNCDPASKLFDGICNSIETDEKLQQTILCYIADTGRQKFVWVQSKWAEDIIKEINFENHDHESRRKITYWIIDDIIMKFEQKKYNYTIALGPFKDWQIQNVGSSQHGYPPPLELVLFNPIHERATLTDL